MKSDVMVRIYLVDLEHIIRISNPRESHTELNTLYWETDDAFIVEYAKDNGIIYRAEVKKDEIKKNAPLESSDEHAIQLFEMHTLKANRFIKILGEYKPKFKVEGSWD